MNVESIGWFANISKTEGFSVIYRLDITEGRHEMLVRGYRAEDQSEGLKHRRAKSQVKRGGPLPPFPLPPPSPLPPLPSPGVRREGP